MRKRVQTLLLSIALAVPCTASPPADPHAGPMPETLISPASPYPIFVRQDRVLLPDGTIDPAMFSEANADLIQRWFLSREPDQPCVEGLETASHKVADPELRDFLSIAEKADFVVVARVTGTAVGFGGFRPGTASRLRPQQWLKGRDDWEVKYLFLPAGEMILGEIGLCATHDHFVKTPEDGDRVLIAYDDSLPNRRDPWVKASAPQIIVLRPDGKVELPRWVRDRQPEWVEKSAMAVIGEVRRHLQSNPGAEP